MKGRIVTWSIVLLAGVLLCFAPLSIASAKDEIVVAEEYFSDSFPLFTPQLNPKIIVDTKDAAVVNIAANAFAEDLLLLSGSMPEVSGNLPIGTQPAIIVGSFTDSHYIQELVERKKFDSSHIEGGQWESFVITVVQEPWEGLDSALVIAGSDPRGAAFGVFHLTEILGVSPWVWWADAPVERKDALYVSSGLYEFGPPSVKYRGIFINAETWGIRRWAANTLDPELGNMGPKTYERIFELLLRMKSNQLWPAMKVGTIPFYGHPQNQKLADDYGIIIGSSHTDVMLVYNQEEWKVQRDGPWDYSVNSVNIKAAWDARAKQTAGHENVYQLGIRGLGDRAMEGIGTIADGVRILNQAIQDQQEILAKNNDRDITEIPQIFTPYKEVIDMYDAGVQLPDHVTLMWSNDNFGYMERYSSPEEQLRPGGGGVYYHVMYNGLPHPYMWLETNSHALTWRELNRAKESNMMENWIINVGDIKRREWGAEFFLQLAWDIDRWDQENLKDYLTYVAGRDIQKEYAQAIADLMWDYYLLAIERKPELMGFSFHGYGSAPVNDPDYSLINYGDEAQQRIDDYDNLRTRVEELYTKIQPSSKDAFFELVLYPVRGAANLNNKLLHAYKSRIYTYQGRAEANYHADMAEALHQQILDDTYLYNKVIANGKWDYITMYNPGTNNGATVHHEPEVGRVNTEIIERFFTTFGVAVQGAKDPMDAKFPARVGYLPTFNRYIREKFFIDVFNNGTSTKEWNAEASEPWILMSNRQGVLAGEEGNRLWVDIDYSILPDQSRPEGQIKITSETYSYTVGVRVYNEKLNLKTADFIEADGVVSIQANNYSRLSGGTIAQWESLNGLGRSGAAMILKPLTGWYIENLEQIVHEAPSMEYEIMVTKGGQAVLEVQAVPSFAIVHGNQLRLGVSFDDGDPQWVTFAMGAPGEQREFSTFTMDERLIWRNNVAGNAMYGKISLALEPGNHTLKVWGVDPSINVDKIVINFGGVKDSYLGPTQTKIEFR